jgi:hypothetical protein
MLTLSRIMFDKFVFQADCQTIDLSYSLLASSGDFLTGNSGSAR